MLGSDPPRFDEKSAICGMTSGPPSRGACGPKHTAQRSVFARPVQARGPSGKFAWPPRLSPAT